MYVHSDQPWHEPSRDTMAGWLAGARAAQRNAELHWHGNWNSRNAHCRGGRKSGR